MNPEAKMTEAEKRQGWLFSVGLKHAEHIHSAIYELRDQSDRAAAIVAATILDLVLTSALEEFLQPHPKEAKEFLAITGPVGDFKAKIDLALLVGLVDKAAHRDLVTVRDIRNYFAHKLNVSSFKSEAVASLSKNIKIAESRTHDDPEQDGSYNLVGKLSMSLGIKDRETVLDDPRERFLLSVRLLIWDLSMPKKPGQSKPIR
jgi:hypothetical protein